MESKFVKGYCRKTGQHFGLELKKIGSEWKVVNFVDITAKEASAITSEISQSRFLTNDNLLPCRKCSSRVVSGCSCPEKSFQCRAGVYNFQCIYCKNMQIDYSAASVSSGYKEGDIIRLSQGQEIKVKLDGDKPLKKIIVGIGWDPSTVGPNMDVDSSVIVAGNRGREIVYYGDLEHPSGCVIHHGDNLTGEDEMEQGDDENITVYLEKVPQNRDRLIFVVNIYECISRHQKFGNVKNMYIRLYDPVSRKGIIEYKITGNMSSFTALVIGMVYRRDGEWIFKAIGNGSYATSIHGLADEVAHLR